MGVDTGMPVISRSPISDHGLGSCCCQSILGVGVV